MIKYNLKTKLDIQSYLFFNPSISPRDGIEDIKIILDSKFNVEDEYSQIQESIIRMISITEFLCKGISESYIENRFNDADMVIVISDSIGLLPNGNIFGFALLNFNVDDNSLYISIFCSHTGIYGAGEVLMKQIQDICKTLLITRVHLTSVKDAVSFYEKYGFVKHDPSCVSMCEMTKILSKGKTRKKFKKKRFEKGSKKVQKRFEKGSKER